MKFHSKLEIHLFKYIQMFLSEHLRSKHTKKKHEVLNLEPLKKSCYNSIIPLLRRM